MRPITDPNTESTDLKYWDKVLKTHGLSMSAGAVPSRKVSFVGGLNNLVSVEEQDIKEESGKVKPSGNGPDK
jgi:hypothetical protein